jgi:DNA-binding transcriptional ArsR family regulator
LIQLGDSARLRLLTRLIGRALCVRELAAAEGEFVSAISHHLRILRPENIVTQSRDSCASQHITQMVLKRFGARESASGPFLTYKVFRPRRAGEGRTSEKEEE